MKDETSHTDSDALIHDPDGGVPRLLRIMERLRDPETGCPWDIVQSFETIVPYTIEEAYEVADAIERQDHADLRDELGDLLLQVVYHAQMAREAGHFGFDDVAQAISDKMVRRHPHVFGDESRDKSPEDQTRDWETIKAGERKARARAASALDGVAAGLPALTRAVKLQNRAARVGHAAIVPDLDVLAEVAVHPEQEVIAPREVGGVLSEGMLCSETELSIGEDTSGIVVLDMTTRGRPGESAAEVLGLERDA